MFVPLVLAACGGDALSSQSASDASASAVSRETAQTGYVFNSEAVACLQANSSAGEWAIIAGQDANGEAMLQTVLNRDATRRCFVDNNVTVYL